MAKIILAEDDNDMRRFLVKALQNAGYEVVSYDNGLSAYQRLREEPFELLPVDRLVLHQDRCDLVVILDDDGISFLALGGADRRR